ncbi:MAG: hypothetical protein L3J89_03250 [Gammaproteobacteria bacterium]|nr:hypothetical protein [Gammaproteobacteria bacterium]
MECWLRFKSRTYVYGLSFKRNPGGQFKADDQFALDIQVFIDEKPEYYCFSNETRKLTGEEAFAEFTP